MHSKEARGLRTIAFVVALFAATTLMADAFAPVGVPPVEVSPTPAAFDPSAPTGFFTENAAQVENAEILYYARGDGVSVGFAAGAVLVDLRERPARDELRPWSGPAPFVPAAPAAPLRGHMVRIAMEGANPIVPRAREELPHRANFFLGDDPARWRTGVRNYAEVVYENAWDGIDVVYRPSPGGVKYDLVVHPGADLADIAFAYEGVDGLAVTPRGLSAETSLGPLRDDLPAAWQASGQPVACAIRPIAERTVGYACLGWDGTGDLVIDPLLYSTFLGGSANDNGFGIGIAVDASGAAYVTSTTYSTDFPTTPGAYDTTHNGNWDAFVAKLDPTGGGLLYSTYLGGGGDYDGGTSVAVDASGAAYVTGYTESSDFPTTPGAYDTTHNDNLDAFVAKLDPTGGGLLYSTYLGGGSHDGGSSVAVDASGSAYVTGWAYSTVPGRPDFPTTPSAFDTTHNGYSDAFVTKLNATGSGLLYSTYLGGGSYEVGYSIVLDVSGSAYVTGYTGSLDFPTTPGAFDISDNGGHDAFVTKLSPTGSGLLYSTYLGGGNSDGGASITVDAFGGTYVTGYTESSDFPTTPGAFDTTYNGGLGAQAYDAFVAKLNPTGSGLLYSTYLGGGSRDEGASITVDAFGGTYVTGYTESSDFPTTPGAFDTTYNGGPPFQAFDVFVTKHDLLPEPNSPPVLAFTSPLGGEVWDQGTSHAVTWTASDDQDSSGALVVFLNYTSSAGSGTVCGPVPGSPGLCDWIVPNIVATDVVVNGTLVDTRGLQGWDESGPIRVPPDTMPPTVTIDVPTNGEWTNANPVPVSGTASDVGSGVERVEASCDDGISWIPAAGTAAWSAECAGLAEGAHILHARAFDFTGLESVHDLVTVNVDRTPPSAPALTQADLTGVAFEDLELAWDAAADEGGPGGTTAYRVLQALGDPAGPYGEIATLPADGSPSYAFTCAGCGHSTSDPSHSFFLVQSIDAAGSAADSNLAARYVKLVGRGPHLLTVPLEVSDYDVLAVLQTLKHGIVRAYRAGTPDPWKAWDPDRAGELSTLAFGDGFWVDVAVTGQYTVAGLVRANPTVGLAAGWNLVGYASLASERVDVSLSGVPGVTRVEAFAPVPPYYLRVVTFEEMLLWGEAYWIDTTAGGSWTQG